MERFRSWIPHGFEFYPPSITKELRLLQSNIRSIFESAECEEIIPPLMDFGPTFELSGNDRYSDRVFESRDSRGDLLAVRSDLTVQVIKAVASKRLHASASQKYYYMQPVFIDYPQGTGRIREVFQAGVEWIEKNSVNASENRVSDLLALGSKALQEQKLFEHHPVRFLYSDVRYFDRLIEPYKDDRSEIKQAFYDKNTDYLKFITEKQGWKKSDIEILCKTPYLFGDTAVLPELKDLCKSRSDLIELIELAETVSGVQYDFSIVRDLGYYSGPVFEGYTIESNEKIISGGVYDRLGNLFGMSLKAAGFAINLSAILQAEQRSRSIK